LADLKRLSKVRIEYISGSYDLIFAVILLCYAVTKTVRVRWG
jgi:hypothetical protein